MNKLNNDNLFETIRDIITLHDAGMGFLFKMETQKNETNAKIEETGKSSVDDGSDAKPTTR